MTNDATSPWDHPWHPMINPLDVKHLGKLGEESSELGSAIFRCLIQGIDEAEPVTRKVNRQWLTEEVADVLANIHLVRKHFKLDAAVIGRRITRKVELLKAWHGALEPTPPTSNDNLADDPMPPDMGGDDEDSELVEELYAAMQNHNVDEGLLEMIIDLIQRWEMEK